jgi:hypothetical protein
MPEQAAEFDRLAGIIAQIVERKSVAQGVRRPPPASGEHAGRGH